MMYQTKTKTDDQNNFFSKIRTILVRSLALKRKRQCFLALSFFPLCSSASSLLSDDYSVTISHSKTLTEHSQGYNATVPEIKASIKPTTSLSVSTTKPSTITVHPTKPLKKAFLETTKGQYTLDFSSETSGTIQVSVTPEGLDYPTGSYSITPENITLTSFSIKDNISQTTTSVGFSSNKSSHTTKKAIDNTKHINISALIKELDERKKRQDEREDYLNERENYLKKRDDELDEKDMAAKSIAAAGAVVIIGAIIAIVIKKELWKLVLCRKCRTGQNTEETSIPLNEI